MSDLNRRDLLRGGLAAGATLALGGRAQASCAPNCSAKNLIIVWANGGWDPMFTFDAKPHVAASYTPAGDFVSYGDMPIWINDDDRPGVKHFCDKYADLSAVINGVDVASIAHPSCRRRMLTGHRGAGYADLGAVTGHTLGRELAIPYLVLGDSGYVGPLGASVGRVGRTNQLGSLIDPAQAYSLAPGAGYTPVAPSGPEAALIRAQVVAAAERQQATRGARGYNRARVNDFIDSLWRGDRLVSKRDVLQASKRQLTLTDQLGITADVLEQGLSRAVMIDGRQAWDTHVGLDAQSTLYDELFSALSDLVETLKGRPKGTLGARVSHVTPGRACHMLPQGMIDWLIGSLID